MSILGLRKLSRKTLWIGFAAYCGMFLLLLGLFLYNIRTNQIEQEQFPVHRLQKLSGQIQSQLRGAKELPQAISAAWTQGIITNIDSAKNVILRLQESQPSMFSATLALDPDWVEMHPSFAPSKSGLAYASFIRKPGEKISPLTIPYDYTDPNMETTQWYTLSAQFRKTTWFGPYFGRAAQTYLIGLSTPLFDANRQLIGVAAAEYSLSALRQILLRDAQQETKHDGYTILLNQEGVVLYHPRVELMQGSQSMRSIGEKTNNQTLLDFSDSLDQKSESGAIDYMSIYTRERTRFHYQRIPELGWYLISIAPDREGQPFCYYQKHIFLFFLGFLFLAMWLFYMLFRGRIWVLSLGISAFFAMGILLICWISVQKYESGLCTPLSVLMQEPRQGKTTHDCSRTPLNNSFAASAFMNHCFDIQGSMISIPTGLMIQTISFTSAHSFSASGYLWQKYSNRADTVLLGVEFPENEELEMNLAYDDSLGPQDFVRGWHFTVHIRQPFSYRRYPLDKEEMWLRMRPAGLAQNVMLEPDFLSYRNNNGDYYGLDQNILLAQWSILSTNFSYALNRNSSNYGKKEFYSTSTYPELYFSIHVRRNIFDAFISQFIPLVVIILMLFSILWVGRKSENGLLGFNSLSGATSCSALFFIVIYNHINVREQLGAPGVVYMEYYFFITYIGLLFVSLNSIQVAMDTTSRFINYKDNHASRVLFWPGIMGSLFVCTFVTFW